MLYYYVISHSTRNISKLKFDVSKIITHHQTGGLQGDVPSSSKDINKGPPLQWRKKWTQHETKNEPRIGQKNALFTQVK